MIGVQIKNTLLKFTGGGGILFLIFLVVMIFSALANPIDTRAGLDFQIPTGSIPTVTGTPVGATVLILDNEQGYVNVRAGPHTVAFETIGVLVEGQIVPALGRTRGGDWIQVVYPGAASGVGWVWSDLVDVRGTLPVVESPPTPTPLVTATIDPTLAAQFLVEVPPTRLPTFTAPPEFVKPTMPVDAPVATPGRIPVGMVIIGLAAIGLVGAVISLFGAR